VDHPDRVSTSHHRETILNQGIGISEANLSFFKEFVEK
jgi:hypothetical protein